MEIYTRLAGEESLTRKVGYMSNSEMIHNHIVGIPFHPFLQEEDIRHVVDRYAVVGNLEI